jgi:acetyl esterase/lipase
MVKIVELISLLLPLAGLLVLLAVGFVGPLRTRLKFAPGLVGLLPFGLGLLGAALTFLCYLTPADYITGKFNTEIIFWPALLSLGALLFSLAWLSFWPIQKILGRVLGGLGVASSLAGLAIALIFLSQLSTAADQAEAEMKATFGADYAAKIPANIASQQRSNPFNLLDYYGGLSLDTKAVKLTGDVTYRTVDGQKLLLDVYEPANGEQGLRPALLVIHGGGWQTGDKSEYPELSYYLAARGWTVFSLNYRLLPDYGFPYATEDVQCALAFINQNGQNYGADLSRLAVLGRSAGGTMALTAAYMPGPIASAANCGPLPAIKGVVNYYGETDMVSWHNADGGASLAVPYLGGTPEQKPDNYRLASPMTYVNRSLPPTLIVHGDQDSIVKIGQALKLIPRLKETSSQVAFVRIPWTGHAFDLWSEGPSNQIALYYTERFLNLVTATK